MKHYRIYLCNSSTRPGSISGYAAARFVPASSSASKLVFANNASGTECFGPRSRLRIPHSAAVSRKKIAGTPNFGHSSFDAGDVVEHLPLRLRKIRHRLNCRNLPIFLRIFVDWSSPFETRIPDPLPRLESERWSKRDLLETAGSCEDVFARKFLAKV